MRILSQITELNGYLGPTVKSKRLSTKACHDQFGTYIVEPPIWHLLVRYRPVSVKRRLRTGDRG